MYSKTFPRNTSSFKSSHLRAVGVSRTEDASGGQVLLLARHAFEDAFNVAGCCPQSVESAVLRACEDAFNIAGCRFALSKMHSVEQEAV